MAHRRCLVSLKAHLRWAKRPLQRLAVEIEWRRSMGCASPVVPALPLSVWHLYRMCWVPPAEGTISASIEAHTSACRRAATLAHCTPDAVARAVAFALSALADADAQDD
jgi:hypothetical protein